EGWVSRLAPAPNLCQGELRTDRRAPEGQVHDVRDVLRHLAFDLGSRSGVRAQFARLMPFGDVTVSGSWSGVDGDGVQTLRADWSARLPRPVSGEERDVAERLRVFCVADSDGQVTMRRRIDAAAGRVAEWDGELDLVVEEPQKQFRRLVVHDEWRFTAVRDNQDAEFRKRVAAGIAGGVAFVRDAIDEKKSFLQDKRGEERDFGSGRLALALLTMVHGHVPADDSVLQRGFADLRRRRLTDTYSLAAALMAVAARCAPPDEAELLRSGRLAGRPPRQMDPADRKAADKWLQRLLGNVDPRTDPSDVLRFNYEAGPRYDTSLQQYALLGMWSAQLCGLDVPQGSFAAAARHLLAVQAPALSRAPLSVRTYAQQRLLDQGDRVPQVSPRRVAVRGFAYQEPEEPPFGSMTSAGISGLLLARAGMQAQGDGDRKVLGGIDDAVDAGFAWLGDNFSVRCNPGFAERAGRHWYYWLYGLERSCELFGIARLQDRDWYFEGALQLLAQQQPNGSFKAEHASTLLLDSTCFAVLFLARSTAPAAITTGR
ncbi:MAG: hypothetical protein H6835_21010, partial [Planctomycetes bacterium]|nr:hypothetical protein [Planctomycetota bacterium]